MQNNTGTPDSSPTTGAWTTLCLEKFQVWQLTRRHPEAWGTRSGGVAEEPMEEPRAAEPEPAEP
eukprot:1502907-Pyramimonas_sp.AAC.1